MNFPLLTQRKNRTQRSEQQITHVENKATARAVRVRMCVLCVVGYRTAGCAYWVTGLLDVRTGLPEWNAGWNAVGIATGGSTYSVCIRCPRANDGLIPYRHRTACFTFSCPDLNTSWYPYQHYCMLLSQLYRHQHQLVPISTPLHASLSSTDLNTSWYPYQHHCMLLSQLYRPQHQLVPISTPLHASLSAIPT